MRIPAEQISIRSSITQMVRRISGEVAGRQPASEAVEAVQQEHEKPAAVYGSRGKNLDVRA